MRTIFIFGLGYVGTALARQLSAAGWRIRGTTRSPAALASTTAADWQIFSFAAGHGLEDPGTALIGVDAILSTIAPIDGVDPVIPAPSFELAQTRTVGAHGCWDYLAGVPASSNVGFALGGPRNGRARQKNGRGENRRKWRKLAQCGSSHAGAARALLALRVVTRDWISLVFSRIRFR